MFKWLIDNNSNGTGKWSLLRRVIWLKATVLAASGAVWQTVSGAIASFVTQRAAPIRELVVDVNPVQDLHGYDAPWPPGGGKNLANPTVTVGLNIASSGAEETGTAASTSDYIKVSPSTAYVFYINQSVTGVWVEEYDASKVFIIRSSTVQNEVSFTTNASTEYVRFTINYNGTSMAATQEVINSLEPMLELSPKTSFSTYSNICPISGWTGVSVWVKPEYDTTLPATASVTWEDEAGTVYGGQLTVNEDGTGQIVADRALNLINAESTLNINGTTAGVSTEVRYIPSPTKANGEFNFISSVFNVASGTEVGKAIGRTASEKVFFRVPDSVTTVAEAQAWFGNNPTQICYELATPITYQLTAQQVISALQGQNVMWADCTGSDGEISVTYRSN